MADTSTNQDNKTFSFFFFFTLGADHLTFEGGGGVGDLWSARFFFSSNQVDRIFFYSSARVFFYYICAACNFFLPTSACRKFFSKSPTPSLKS